MGQHDFAAVDLVVSRLEDEIASGGGYEEIVDALQELGVRAASL